MIKCACGCGTEINEIDNKHRERRFISGHNSRINNPRKKEKIEQICVVCGKVYYRCSALANRGKNNYCSNDCRYQDTKKWASGEKNVNWKGGFNGVQNIRWCPEYTEWRKKVFRKDNFTCQDCGNKMTYKNPLHAHHIIKFSDSIEFRFDVDNGLTLCKKCHLERHKTGWKPKRGK